MSRRVQVDRDTLALMLVFAFRYALGRRTAAVPEVAGWLLTWRDALFDWQRRQIADDIARAIAADNAGDQCDVQDWRQVAAAMRAGEDR